jgi:hypothetical protein
MIVGGSQAEDLEKYAPITSIILCTSTRSICSKLLGYQIYNQC